MAVQSRGKFLELRPRDVGEHHPPVSQRVGIWPLLLAGKAFCPLAGACPRRRSPSTICLNYKFKISNIANDDDELLDYRTFVPSSADNKRRLGFVPGAEDY